MPNDSTKRVESVSIMMENDLEARKSGIKLASKENWLPKENCFGRTL
jgi:hypothetical protein